MVEGMNLGSIRMPDGPNLKIMFEQDGEDGDCSYWLRLIAMSTSSSGGCHRSEFVFQPTVKGLDDLIHTLHLAKGELQKRLSMTV